MVFGGAAGQPGKTGKPLGSAVGNDEGSPLGMTNGNALGRLLGNPGSAVGMPGKNGSADGVDGA